MRRAYDRKRRDKARQYKQERGRELERLARVRARRRREEDENERAFTFPAEQEATDAAFARAVDEISAKLADTVAEYERLKQCREVYNARIGSDSYSEPRGDWDFKEACARLDVQQKLLTELPE